MMQGEKPQDVGVRGAHPLKTAKGGAASLFGVFKKVGQPARLWMLHSAMLGLRQIEVI
jgi:hypothetical protein